MNVSHLVSQALKLARAALKYQERINKPAMHQAGADVDQAERNLAEAAQAETAAKKAVKAMEELKNQDGVIRDVILALEKDHDDALRKKLQAEQDLESAQSRLAELERPCVLLERILQQCQLHPLSYDPRITK